MMKLLLTTSRRLLPRAGHMPEAETGEWSWTTTPEPNSANKITLAVDKSCPRRQCDKPGDEPLQ